MEPHHRSCVVPSNAPALPDPDNSIPRRVLQERSGNRRHEYQDESVSWKREQSPVGNAYPHGPGGSHFSSSITSQLTGEKSEAQIEYETKRLLAVLDRCEKYQKYRDRQPANAKEKNQKWSDTLERAFFRGLVRWPPMGRRKYMLDGQLRGRNELVADSIIRDTGETRTRKQVSSHIQVLKNILSNQPQLLMHMSTQDLSGGKQQRHANSHLSHLRNRHHPHAQGNKYEFSSQANSHRWQDGLPASNVPARIQGGSGTECDAPYTVINFTMHVHDERKDPVHHYAQLSSTPRLGDLHVTDTTSWHKQYPELNFHRTEELKDRQVLVCDSSIRVMTEPPSKSDKLAIDFVLKSNNDLSVFEPLQSRTRFYDSGVLVEQYDEQRPEYQAETGRIFVPFGSKFWAERLYNLGKNLRDARMSEEPGLRNRTETTVRRSLQYMTAMQDIYSIKRDTGEQHCFLTVLWRFNQTKSANVSGKMMWRVVNFARPEQRWIKPEEMDHLQASKTSTNINTTAQAATLYAPLSLDFHHQPYPQHPPQLDLDSLSAITMDNMHDYSNPNSATAPTDHSQSHSLPGLSHSQDTVLSHSQSQDYADPNDFDFNGGHINITACLEPAINFGAYENCNNGPELTPLAGMENGVTGHDGNPFDLGMNMGVGGGLYSTKPSWHYADLIQRLEGVAEQIPNLLDDTSHGNQDLWGGDMHGGEVVGHGVLHNGQIRDGLWQLQQSFPEDTDGGAANGMGDEGKGLGILELIERDQRRRDSLGGY